MIKLGKRSVLLSSPEWKRLLLIHYLQNNNNNNSISKSSASALWTIAFSHSSVDYGDSLNFPQILLGVSFSLWTEVFFKSTECNIASSREWMKKERTIRQVKDVPIIEIDSTLSIDKFSVLFDRFNCLAWNF